MGHRADESGRRANAGPTIGALSLCLALTAGCALTNPYIELKNRPQGEISFERAEAFANGAKREYREALGVHTEFNKLLGAGLIPLGAATLGLGITGASPTAVMVLGLTGATAFGLGAWLQSTPTQQAYIAGYNATNCAVEAMLPLKVEGDNERLVSFRSSLDEIDRKIEEVQNNLGTVRRFVATEPNPNKVKLAEDDVSTAKALVDSATAARRNGASLLREIDLAGSKLTVAVDRIAGQVDLMILENQPDLQALSGIIGGLGQSYSRFTAVPESLRPVGEMAGGKRGPTPTGGGKRPPSLEDALADLQKSAAALATTTRQVADFVNALVANKPLEALANCAVDPESIASDIVIEPAGPLLFEAAKGGSQGFVILGGRQPYRAMLVDDSASGLTVTQPELFGPGFVVNASKELAEGEYTVLAADGARHRKFLKVIVAKAAKKTSSGAGNQTRRPTPTPLGLGDAAEAMKTVPVTVDDTTLTVATAAVNEAGDKVVVTWAPAGQTVIAPIAVDELKKALIKTSQVTLRNDQIEFKNYEFKSQP